MSGQNAGGEPTDADDERPVDGSHRSHSLPDRAVADDVQALSALGNDTRYEALRIVVEAEEDVCVCELEPALGVSQGAVSQALSRLFGAGLVDRRKDGRWRYYSATPRARRIVDALDETRESME